MEELDGDELDDETLYDEELDDKLDAVDGLPE